MSEFVSVSFSTSSPGGQTRIRDGVKLYVRHRGQTKTRDGVKLHVQHKRKKREYNPMSCNTLVLSMHLALALHEHKHHWAFMSMSMSNSIFTTLLISHVIPLKLIPRLGFTCDQCVKCLWDLRSTLNMLRMWHATTLVFMTWANLASKSRL